MKSPLIIVFPKPIEKPNRNLQGWKGLFLPFIHAHSKNQRLGAKGEQGKIQVSISTVEPLFLVFIPLPLQLLQVL